MPKVFVSYRREDSGYPAHTIYEKLTNHFGSESVVFDVDTIPLGVDFRRHVQDQVSNCDILLAIIGDRWLETLNQRLDDPRDFVRIEIQAALQRGIPVIPVLVGKAPMPSEGHLPSELGELAYRNAAEVRAGADLANQVTRLVEGVKRLLADQAQRLEESRLTAEPESKLLVEKEGKRHLQEQARHREETDARPAAAVRTQIENGVVSVSLSKDGQIVGARGAVRRIVIDLLEGAWNGEIRIHHARLEELRNDLVGLDAHIELSGEQALQIQQLRRDIAWYDAAIDSVCWAIRLTFQRVPDREFRWGIPMDVERAAAFFQRLFPEANLAPTPLPLSDYVLCQLYLPDRRDSPISISVCLTQPQIDELRAPWALELASIGGHDVDLTTGKGSWDELIPLWRISYEHTAELILPALAVWSGQSCSGAWTDAAAAWNDLSRRFPIERGRDPFNLCHWCLSLGEGRSSKDLAWLRSPPRGRE